MTVIMMVMIMVMVMMVAIDMHIQADLILLRFALLHFFFLQIKGLRQPCIEQVYRRHFSKSICSLCVSVLHLGNSRNISNFFIIIISVDL